MAVFTTHNLYPGKIDTAMPGFLASDEEVKIYFDITPHNSISDIKEGQYLQVSCRYQNSNENALADACALVLKEIQTESGTGKTYFVLDEDDLIEGEFIPYSYYKIQFRFTDAAASNKTNDQTIDQWLMAASSSSTVALPKTNLDESSEWSTVCLIRAISEITLKTDWGTGGTSDSHTSASVVGDIYNIYGAISFDEEGTEYLKSVNIRWQNTTVSTDKGESGIIYTNQYGDSYNQFNYEFNNVFTVGKTYAFEFEITTNTLYKQTYYYDVAITTGTAGPNFGSAPVITMSNSEEDGYIQMHIKYTYSTANDYLVVYRFNSFDNYAKKEKIYDELLETGTNKEINLYDTSIESGILYKYQIGLKRIVNEEERYGTTLYPTIPAAIGVIFNHMFLKCGRQQLNIKFNPQISSIKTVYSESKTDTLGSQYPFIRRNAAVKYKTFPISGLISYFMDENHWFNSREYEYGNNLSAYNTFNDNNGVDYRNDYTYERLFREKVQAFLEDGEVKLFKSPTEGNILVRLMDVNFTPNQTNGRMIWNFSATAYEIAEATIQNINKYNIKAVNTDADNYGEDNYSNQIVTHSYVEHEDNVQHEVDWGDSTWSV